MKTPFVATSFQQGRIHPLLATAAVAVTLVSLVGVAALTGLLPPSQSTPAPVAALTSQAPALVTPAAPARYTGNIEPGQPLASERETRPQTRHVPVRKTVASNEYVQHAVPSSRAPAVCENCGQVESIIAQQHEVPASGVGIGVGAVLGGLLGNRVGGGNGRTLATVAGAVAGGYGGNEVEKRTRTTTSYEVRVRMENGAFRNFPQDNQNWRVGDHVRVVNGVLNSRG